MPKGDFIFLTGVALVNFTVICLNVYNPFVYYRHKFFNIMKRCIKSGLQSDFPIIATQFSETCYKVSLKAWFTTAEGYASASGTKIEIIYFHFLIKRLRSIPLYSLVTSERFRIQAIFATEIAAMKSDKSGNAITVCSYAMTRHSDNRHSSRFI